MSRTKEKNIRINLNTKFDARGLKSMVEGLQKVVTETNKVRAGVGRMVDGFRQLTQGLLSVGRALTFFVSVPVVAFMKSAYDGAIQFEQQMVRVEKVMSDAKFGDRIQDFGQLSKFFRDISTVSISAPEDFARFAEQFGQLGIVNVDDLAQLVVMTDVFSQAVDGIPADQAAMSLGRLANSFGYNLAGDTQEAIAWLDRATNTINELENQTGTTAGSIITSLQDVGAYYSLLSVPFPVVAGWAALGQQVGLSADEVGTALKNIPIFIAQNIDKIENITALQNIWNDATEAGTAFEWDFADAIKETVRALANNDSALESMAASTDLTSRRGAKLLQVWVAQYQELDALDHKSDEYINGLTEYERVLGIAAKGWEENNSLMTEYERVLESNGAKIKMLQNNVKALSLTIGDDLLPVIGKTAETLIPFVKLASELFVELSDKTKKTIVLFVGLLAIVGPLAFFFNQIAFGLILAFQGFAKILAIIPVLVSAFGVLVGQLLRFNPLLILITSLIVGLFKNAKGAVIGITDVIINILKGLAETAEKWGATLMDSYATGIESGASAVISGLNVVIQAIANFIQAFSPPKKGPLSQIGMWGKNLMHGWMDGMMSADFSMLKKITSTVAGIFKALTFSASPSGKDSSRKKALQGIINFREKFSEILAVFRETGAVAEDMLDSLVAGLGDAGDEMKSLIKDFLKYEGIMTKIRNLESQRTKVLGQYGSKASAIGADDTLTAEEKVELLAQAEKSRDDELRIINSEVSALEDEADMVQENINLQQEMLGALQDQSDLWQELLTVIERINTSVASTGQINIGGGQKFTDLGLLTGELTTSMQELDKRLLILKIRMFKAKAGVLGLALSFRALWTAMTTGSMEGFATLNQDLLDALDTQGFLDGVLEEISGWGAEYQAEIDKELSGVGFTKIVLESPEFAEMHLADFEIFGDEFTGFDTGFAEDLGGGMEKIATGFQTLFDVFESDGFSKISEAFSTGFMSGKKGGNTTIEKIANAVGRLASALADIAPDILSSIVEMGTQFLDKIFEVDEDGTDFIDDLIEGMGLLRDILAEIVDNGDGATVIGWILALKVAGPTIGNLLSGLATGVGFGMIAGGGSVGAGGGLITGFAGNAFAGVSLLVEAALASQFVTGIKLAATSAWSGLGITGLLTGAKGAFAAMSLKAGTMFSYAMNTSLGTTIITQAPIWIAKIAGGLATAIGTIGALAPFAIAGSLALGLALEAMIPGESPGGDRLTKFFEQWLNDGWSTAWENFTSSFVTIADGGFQGFLENLAKILHLPSDQDLFPDIPTPPWLSDPMQMIPDDFVLTPEITVEPIFVESVNGFNLDKLLEDKTMPDLEGWFFGGWETMAEDIATTGESMASGLSSGVDTGWVGVESNMKGKANNLIDIMNKAFDISSPSGVFEDIGENLMEGLELGMDKAYPALLSKAEGIYLELSALTQASGNALTNPNITVNVDSPTVRDDSDIDAITDSVIREINAITDARKPYQ